MEIRNTNFGHLISSKWGKARHGIPHGSILGPLLFLLYINDLQNFVKNKCKPIPFADSTSIIVNKSNLTDFLSDIMTVFEYLNKWFRANSLSSNFDKTISYNLQLKMDPKLTCM
jgi:hypothetical protein